MNNILINHPASLFIGNGQELLEHSITLLQNVFCSSIQPVLRSGLRQGFGGQAGRSLLSLSKVQDEWDNSPLVVSIREANVPVRHSSHGATAGSNHAGPCSVCITCRKVQEQQHESVLWLMPEKQYALEDLKPIFSTIAFALEPEQHYFFVIQNADLLTTNCANALLKSLEEPPAGYHFILLAQRLEYILPTIKSRCLIQTVGNGDQPIAQSALMPYFITTAFQDPLAFTKELEAANPNEWESLTLLDELLAHWAAVYKKQIIAQNQKGQDQAHRMMEHLKKAILAPPMPGSSKLFWKNFFLQIKEL